MTADQQAQAIEIRLDGAEQLFNTLDPFPFHERDLDSDAEEYIVGWARELSRQGPFTIIVHLPAQGADGEAARGVPNALSRFFASRLAGSQVIASWAAGTYLGRFMGESLVILGWVANWRPIEIFLYDWWPILRRRNLYRRLAEAKVIIKGDA